MRDKTLAKIQRFDICIRTHDAPISATEFAAQCQQQVVMLFVDVPVFEHDFFGIDGKQSARRQSVCKTAQARYKKTEVCRRELGVINTAGQIQGFEESVRFIKSQQARKTNICARQLQVKVLYISARLVRSQAQAQAAQV